MTTNPKRTEDPRILFEQWLFNKRVPNKPVVNGMIFGMFANKAFDLYAEPCTLAAIFPNLIQGNLSNDLTMGNLIWLAGQLHASVESLALPAETTEKLTLLVHPRNIPAPAYYLSTKYIDPTTGQGLVGISRKILILLETQAFAMMWPERRADLIAKCAHYYVAEPAFDRAIVVKWLCDVSISLDSATIEGICRELYCNMRVSVATANRTMQEVTSYEQYRDLDKLIPQADFEAGVQSAAMNTPRDIVECRERLAFNATVFTCAALSIMVHFLNSVCDLPEQIQLLSNRAAGIQWLPAWSIHVTETDAHMSVAEDHIVRAASNDAEDIVYAFMQLAAEHFQISPLLQAAAERLRSVAVDPDMPGYM